MTEHNPHDGSSSPSESSPPEPGFQIGNVLKLVLPLVLLGAGALVFFGYFDGKSWLMSSMHPPLVMAKGQVIYQGKPLAGAQISTRHTNRKLMSSIGWTDDEGRFTLRTDIDGYVDGAYAGEHQIAITAYQLTASASAPPLITPEIYASLDTSPLRVVVAKSADKNEYTLTLEGDPPERAGPAGGGGFDPEAIAARVFDTFDKDKDGQLSSEELQAIEDEQRAERILQADANEDGIVERAELLEAMSAMRPPGPPGDRPAGGRPPSEPDASEPDASDAAAEPATGEPGSE